MKFSAAFLLILTISVASSAKFVDDPYFVAMENREIRFQKSELSKLEYSCKNAQANLQRSVSASRSYNQGSYMWVPAVRDAQKKQNARLAEIAKYRRSNPRKAAVLQAEHEKLMKKEWKRVTGPTNRQGFNYARRINIARSFVKNCPSKLKAQREYVDTLKKKIEQERERREEEAQN